MKKPTEKRIKEYLKNIELNFSELIDDIIGFIEKLPRKERVQYLFDDLSNRISDDLINSMYTKL